MFVIYVEAFLQFLDAQVSSTYVIGVFANDIGVVLAGAQTNWEKLIRVISFLVEVSGLVLNILPKPSVIPLDALREDQPSFRSHWLGNSFNQATSRSKETTIEVPGRSSLQCPAYVAAWQVAETHPP